MQNTRGPYVIQSDLVGARFGEFYKKRDAIQTTSSWHASPLDATFFVTKADAQQEIDRAFPSHPEGYLVMPADVAYATHCIRVQRLHMPTQGEQVAA